MGQLTFTMKYKKNSGMLFSVPEFYEMFLYGIKIQGVGSDFSDESVSMYIKMAQKEVENFYNLKFCKQLIDKENTSYHRADYWQSFPIVKTNYPVSRPMSLIGMLNKAEQIIFPQTWLTCHRGNMPMRRISVVPTGSSMTEGNAEVILTGITSQIGFQRFENIPDYWEYQYITGFDLDDLPHDLINIVGKMATFGPLAIAGDLIFSIPGISSMSLGIDGLSQSISSTATSTSAGYNARILQYKKEIEETTKRLKLVYDQIKFEVL